MNEYHFVSRWRVRGTREEVFRVLEDAESLPRWWPAAYQSVRKVEEGDSGGIGAVYELVTMGWLPYKIHWRFRTIEKRFPERIAIEAFGDFEGRGVWKLRQEGEWVEAEFDWRIRAEKPLIRALTPLLKPMFGANHRWAMARGQDSLRLEIERRRVDSAEALTRIPTPPGPSRATPVLFGAAAVGILAAAILLRKKNPPE